MMAGKHVFNMKDGKLELAFDPSLPGWMFNEQGEIAFKFLGSTEVVYHNPAKKDTYGFNRAEVKSMSVLKKDGQTVEISAAALTGELAEEVRNGLIQRIDIKLA
ncbi:hypothetical protein D3C73_859480 [compost metagenome]